MTHTDQSATHTSTVSELPTTDSATEEPVAKRRETEKSTDGEAEFELGNCLWYGKTVKRNRAEAIEKYKIAASLGNVRAMCKLGDIYVNGEEGVAEKDESQAAEWYKKAAESGDIYAKDMVEMLEATDVEELE